MKKRYLFLLLIILGCSYLIYRIQYTPYDNPIAITHIPTFTSVPIAFEHEFKLESALPFSGAAVIELDDDSVPELFLSGGYLQRDGLFKYINGKFKDISAESGLSKDIGDSSYGAASVDVNLDGYTDLLVARDSGLYLYLNQNSIFTKHKLVIEFAASETPLSLALADINRDGLIDIYVACFSKPEHISAIPFGTHKYPGSGKLLLNKGSYNFTDISKEAGLTQRRSAYTAVFANLNADRWLDLVVAYHSEPPVVYQNINGQKFKPIEIDALKNLVFASSIAVADVNNDQKPDLMFSSTGSTVPKTWLQKAFNKAQKPDSKWVLLENKGRFQFENTASSSLLSDYELGQTAVFADFNLDGLQDLLVGQNNISFWPYLIYRNTGKLLIQKNDDTFAATTKDAHIKNRHFAVDPVIADFNQDGYMDLVWLNLNGPARAFINNGGNARYIQIDLGDRPDALGATITMQTNDGRTLYTQQIGGGGVSSDHTHIQTLAISQQAVVEELAIEFPSGRSIVLDSVETNQILKLKPGRLEKAQPMHVVPTESVEEEIEELVQDADPVPSEEFVPGGVDETRPPPEASVEDELESLLSP